MSIHPPEWQTLRTQLLRFSQIQLPDSRDLAEDLVQEALLAAYERQAQFQGRSQFQTWAFAILKNKIADALRSRIHHRSVFVETEADTALDEAFDAEFNQHGFWQRSSEVPSWQMPENHVHQQQFQSVLEACLEALPEATARVFMMREFLDFDTDEVCRQCGLTSNHYYVVMHRAREALRQCLQIKWFNGETA